MLGVMVRGNRGLGNGVEDWWLSCDESYNVS